jgi:rRNA-processing protein FCF1
MNMQQHGKAQPAVRGQEIVNSPQKKEKQKVILDSNAFFVPLKFKIDIFDAVEKLLGRHVDFILLSSVKRELELLAAKDSPQTRREAAYALQLAQKCLYVPVEGDKESVDDVILRVAEAWNVPVFTNDKQLRMRLKDISVPVIYVRQKSRLEIDGLI